MEILSSVGGLQGIKNVAVFVIPFLQIFQQRFVYNRSVLYIYYIIMLYNWMCVCVTGSGKKAQLVNL